MAGQCIGQQESDAPGLADRQHGAEQGEHQNGARRATARALLVAQPRAGGCLALPRFHAVPD